ncbi:MAG: PAS domain-containing protein [Myxococcales bacterium]|nr:PAS domain-containing protein [Myxococcales bacterium]
MGSPRAQLQADGWEAWLSESGELTWIQPAVEELCACSRDALIAGGDPFAMFLPSEGHELHRALAAVLDGAISAEASAVVALRSGLTETVSVRLERVTVGAALKGVHLSARLGERDRAQFLLEVLDIDPSLVFVKDRQGRFVFGNQAVADVYGVSPDELVGRLDADFNRNVEEVEMFRRQDEAVLSQQREIFIPEERVSGTDGLTRWLQMVKRPMLGRDGSPKYLLGVATDITSRKLAEDERRQLDHKLRDTQKLEGLGVLAGGIAHDFNNLLTGVVGNAGLAMRQLSADSPIAQRLQQIDAAARQASDLCNQMLTYAGKGHVAVEPADLSTLVRDTTQLLRLSISKKAALEMRLDQSLPPVKIDAAQIRQVVMNLVINASDALGGNPGKIKVVTGCMEVDAAALSSSDLAPDLAEGRYVFLEVSDTGAGMSAETLARIYDPFFTTKFKGRGLGLAAVQGIVLSHRGAIRARSELGQGTTFRMFLPAHESRATRVPPVVPAQVHKPFSGKILLVEDEEMVRNIVRDLLVDLGFDVTTAQDGSNALEQFSKAPQDYSLVLCDLLMPDLDGEQTYHALTELRPDLRFVLMSGFAEHEALARLGPNLGGFLQKPFRSSALTAVLQKALQRDPAPAH